MIEVLDQQLFDAAGLTEEGVFSDPRIKVWRKLDDRENCTLDFSLPDGRQKRFHIKRQLAGAGCEEAKGISLLRQAGIPTVSLVAWCEMPDDRSFVILEDLSGFSAADKLIESGVPFETLLEPTAALAGKLHAAGLHHRDLYLCHFFAKIEADAVEVRLIDAARVKRLPPWPFRNRWINKDLAEFWYSASKLSVTAQTLDRWLEVYAQHSGIRSIDSWRPSIQRKAASIERHDRQLRRRQPRRNISIDAGQHR